MHVACFLYVELFRGWFKGNDTRSLARYIEWRYSRFLADYTNDGPLNLESYLVNIWQAASHANNFLRRLYHNPLWMDPSEAMAASHSALQFLAVFNILAARSYELGYPRYKLTCKLHMMGHLAHQLREEGLTHHKVLNPLAASCQIDEDMVGRVCALARACPAATMHERVLQKYLVNVAVRI